MDFKKAIRIIKLKANLDREEIAKKLQYNPSYLSSLLKRPTEEFKERLFQYFGKELEGENLEKTVLVKAESLEDIITSGEERLIRIESMQAVLLNSIARILSKGNLNKSGVIESALQGEAEAASLIRIGERKPE